MQRLANFSIETDNVVLLEFKNGSSRRVATSQLGQHLEQSDLERVRAALKLRRSFINTHLPGGGSALVLALAACAWLLVSNGGLVAQVLPPPSIQPPPPPPEQPARAVVMPPAPAPRPVSSPPRRVAAATPLPQTKRFQTIAARLQAQRQVDSTTSNVSKQFEAPVLKRTTTVISSTLEALDR